MPACCQTVPSSTARLREAATGVACTTAALHASRTIVALPVQYEGRLAVRAADLQNGFSLTVGGGCRYGNVQPGP
jgi:hypothetical protein